MSFAARSLRSRARGGFIPFGTALQAAGLRPPRTDTIADRETVLVGSVPATVGVIILAALIAVWAHQGGAYIQTVVGLGAAYLVGALGYNLVLGNAGQFAFCQNAFMAIGAYGYAVTAPHTGAVPAFLIAAAAATLASALLGVAVMRTRDIYLALLTLAFSQATLLAIEVWPATQGDNGIGVPLDGSSAYLVAVVCAAVALLITQRTLRSRLGQAFALIRSEERAAAAMGVNVPLTRSAAFALSGFLGGVSGILLAGVLTFVTPTNFTISLTLLLLTMIVIGGVGSAWGTVVGVGIIVAVQQYLPTAGAAGDYVNAALLFVILALRPRGLASLLRLRYEAGNA